MLQDQRLASMCQMLVSPNSKEEGQAPQVHPNWGLSIIHITVVAHHSHHRTNNSLLHKHSHNILGDPRAPHQLQPLQDQLKWANRVHHTCKVSHHCSKVSVTWLICWAMNWDLHHCYLPHPMSLRWPTMWCCRPKSRGAVMSVHRLYGYGVKKVLVPLHSVKVVVWCAASA